MAWIVDFLFPETFFRRPSFCHPTEVFCFRVVLFRFPRLRSLSPVAEISFSPNVHFLSAMSLVFLTASLGCDLWRSVSIHSEEWMKRFPSVMSVSNSFEKVKCETVSSKPFVVTEVVPKNCYCYSSQRCTVVGTTALGCALPFHFQVVVCRSLTKLRFFL